MDILKVMDKMPDGMKKQAVKLGKHAPDIMVIVGAGMVIGSAVNACRQTLKAHDILEQANDDLEKIEKAADISNPEDYTEQDMRKDRMTVYSKTAVGLARVYGPSVVIGLTGMGLIFGAHKIIKDRNTALTIAYSNLLTAYTAYQQKVADAIGEEKEFQLRSGYSKEEIKVIDEDGKEKTIKNAKVLHDDGHGHSIYARIFDDSLAIWSKNPSTNLQTLRSLQNFANDKLRAQGVLFLNEVYEQIGFPRTPEGQLVGWVFDPGNPNIDSYVDFGIYDKLYTSEGKRDFLNGYEPCIWLDFNVDGQVYDLL